MSDKKYPIQIWFLDDDLQKSAQYQTNKSLVKSISGCMKALIAARFYFIGIRSKKIYDYMFDDAHREMTLETHFPMWPLQQKPGFLQYASKESKWTRKCKEHYDYVKQYFNILLDEYLYRFKKEHGLCKLAEWLEFDAPKIAIPAANMSKIIVPWKNIDIKWRRKNIIDGYRLQFMNTLEGKPEEVFMKTRRDIPDFVIKYFKLGNELV